MIRHVRWLLCLCVACAGIADPERATSTPPNASQRSVHSVVEPPPPISGTHGAAIVIVAATTEGDAAITADVHGAIRVWPALDGSREPVVLHAGPPSELAIAHDGDGFVVANIDVAKGLELIRIDREGRVRERVMTRGEAIEDLAWNDHRAVVLRADQTIDVLEPNGARIATLVPEAGTRVVRLLAAGDRVLAISERGATTFARWIDERAWGSTTPSFAPPKHARLSVSPDRTLLVTNQLGVARTISLATGKQGPAVCSLAPSSISVALGFIDADTVACSDGGGGLSWWSMKQRKTIGGVSQTPPLDEALDVIAGGVLLSRSGHDLVVRSPAVAKQLGYATSSNTVVRLAAGGITIAGGRRSLVVDRTLRARSSIEHPLDEGLLAIGDGFAIGISTPEVSVNDAWGESHALSVFDIARKATHQKLAVRTSDALAFERATGLLATIDGAQTHVLRYDPKTHMFGAPVALEADGVIHRVALLDPALSNGVVAMTLEKRVSSVIVGEIDARDLVGSTVKTKRTYRVAGDLLAVDRGGRVYTLDPGGRVHVAKGDHPPRELPIPGAISLVPDDDGARFVVVTRTEIALYLADGTHVWSAAARDVRQVRWVGKDLVASFANSLARFDLATGELAARQCGWEFGLHDITPPDSADNPNVCDAD